MKDPTGTYTKSGRIPVSHINMVERALTQGWITVEKAEELAPQRMLEILQRKSPRGWIAATRLLDSMKRTNLLAIETAMKAMVSDEHVEELQEQAQIKEMLMVTHLRRENERTEVRKRLVELALREHPGLDRDKLDEFSWMATNHMELHDLTEHLQTMLGMKAGQPSQGDLRGKWLDAGLPNLWPEPEPGPPPPPSRPKPKPESRETSEERARSRPAAYPLDNSPPTVQIGDMTVALPVDWI